MEVDVLVVGAGPAGSTTARYCSDKRLSVHIIDRRAEIGYPVQCGEFLPDAKEMYSIFPKSMNLEELLAVEDQFVAGETDYMDLVSPKGRNYRVGFKGNVLDRRRFDKHLVKLAVEAGATLETKTALLSVRDGTVVTDRGDIHAKVIVGADGPSSRTGRAVGLATPSGKYPAVTCQARGSFENAVKMYFGSVAPGGYAWVIPKRGGSANVGLGVNPLMTAERPSKLFRQFVSMIGCHCSEQTMGFVPMSGPIPATVRGKTILVGDAAGFVMPTNGGGIPTAMMAGRIAGTTVKEHLIDGTGLMKYEERWRSVLGKPLSTSLWTRKLADMFFPYDRALELAMMLLGRQGLDRAIRCKRAFNII